MKIGNTTEDGGVISKYMCVENEAAVPGNCAIAYGGPHVL